MYKLRLVSSMRNLMWKKIFSVLIISAIFCPQGTICANLGVKLPMSNSFGVAGATGKLPCLVTHRQGKATPVLVLWYKDGARLPFYTLDLREGGNKEEFVDQEIRTRVRADLSGSHLTFEPLEGSDTGIYKCRVDFEDSPTLAALVNLTVYVVPSRLVIVTRENRQVTAGFLGPLTEGESLTLYCVVTGGRPTPKVTWWHGNYELPSHSVTLGSGSTPLASHEVDDPLMTLGIDMGMGLGIGLTERRVRSEVIIPSLTREFARANLTCKAQNNNITEALSTTISLDLYLRPEKVEIKAPRSPLQEGRVAEIKCVSSGSYPSAVVSWEITQAGRSEVLPAEYRSIGDSTSSVLDFVPHSRYHGARLRCRAHNPNIPGKGIQVNTVLQIHFAPRVKLRLGANLEGQSITEGEDLYFECEVACNPPAREILWFKDGERVHQDPKNGVLLSTKNLVLQEVRRTSAGNYTCAAGNELGTTTSNVVRLAIRFFPVCTGIPQTISVAEGESVRLSCEVDAEPEDNLHFTWYFNNTLDTVEVERHRVEVERGRSFLDYTPRSARDYGTLSCWATNDVGTQADPCRFTVIEAGPPDSVTNCTLLNLTISTLEVECEPGSSSGGLAQHFVANVYVASTHVQVATLRKADRPRFFVGGLTPGQDYHITVSAVNEKGWSEPVEIDAVRSKVAENRMVDVSSTPMSPLVGVFLGLVGGFILLLGAGILLTRVRSNRCRCLRHDEGLRKGEDSGGGRGKRGGGGGGGGGRGEVSKSNNDDDDDDGPDIVKTTNETAQLLDAQKRPEIVASRRPPSYTQSKIPIGSDATCPEGSVSRVLVREPVSPRRLNHDESFV